MQELAKCAPTLAQVCGSTAPSSSPVEFESVEFSCTGGSSTDLATLAGVAEQRPPSVTPGDRVSPPIVNEPAPHRRGHLASTTGIQVLSEPRSCSEADPLVTSSWTPGTFSIERRRAKASPNRAFACYGHCRRQMGRAWSAFPSPISSQRSTRPPRAKPKRIPSF